MINSVAGRYRLKCSVLFGLFCAAPAVMADPFLWASSSEGTHPASVFSINPLTGSASLIGPVGVLDSIGRVNKVSAIAVDPTDGTLYGMFGSNCSGARLITIDKATGVGSPVGYLVGAGFDGSQDTGGSFQDELPCLAGSEAIAFTAEGTLYAGGWNGGSAGGKLLVVDKTTGAVTANLPTDPPPEAEIAFGAAIAGLAVHPVTGDLWVSRGNNTFPGKVHIIDPATGSFTYTVELSPSVTVSDIAFTTDGVLYGSVPNAGKLVRINTITGAVTDVGPFGGGEKISGMAGIGYFPSQTSVEDIPTPTGTDVPVIELDSFVEVASQVIVAGTTDVEVCVAPDIRELGGRGRGKGNRARYVPRNLSISDLSNMGSCGDLSGIDLVIPSWYRGYPGKFPMDETGVDGVWLIVTVVKTTAEFDGPVVVVPKAEALIDYSGPGVVNPVTACGVDLDWRPLSLGGAVEAFGDFPNAEGRTMIKETAQCNRLFSMTRRTTHVYPVRLDHTPADETVNIGRQLTGLSRTLNEIAQCVATPDAGYGVSIMQYGLNVARRLIQRRRYEDAVESLEQIARDAKFNSDDFSGCPIEANYKGNIMSRALSAAFSVFDRKLHPDPSDWEIYLIPDDLDVPVLTSDSEPPVEP